MKKIFTLLTLSVALLKVQAQSITTVENVYGGRILGITSSSISGFADSANVFITTESANTAFYAKANGITTGAVNISSFTKMPALTATSGVGSAVQKIASFSSYMYYMGGNTIYKTAFNSSTISNTRTFGFFDTSLVDFTIKGNRLWYFFKVFSSNQDRFAYSDLDASGNIINYVSPHGYNNTMYPTKNVMSYNLGDSILVFKEGNNPELTILENISTGVTAFAHDNLSTLSSSIYWRTAAIAPDGRIYIGGHSATHKHIAYKDVSSGTWTSVATGINGVSGNNITFYSNVIGNYYVYFGSAYSNAKGVAASWNNLGNTSFETHSNDGASLTLANSITSGVVLFTTDEGLGWTKNAGSIIKEINTGIEAVQVSDFDMRFTKDFGWLASKAGVRFVRNYNTPSKTWSNAMFPNGDGSPYYSAEMIGNDSNSVYVGNLRIYKTINKGANWNQVFTPEVAPYNFPSVGTQASAIAVSDSVNNIVLAGFKIQGTQRGGVFVSNNGGSSWSQLLINATTTGFDVDVNDIEIVSDSGRVVAYIGVEYDSSLTTPLRGMYKAQWDGISWSVRAEEIYTPTTSLINVTDIVIHSKDTILASGGFFNKVYGREYGINFMVSRPVFNTWRSYVPSVARFQPFSAAAWNGDTLFYAYKDSILYSRIIFSSSGTGTPGEALYSKVDNGTEINVLYYDELLVGSGTGFRSVKGANFVLPNKAISLLATLKNNSIELNWSNNFDEQVMQYQLEYSCKGSAFLPLATINSNNSKNYTYNDISSCNDGFKLYRIKIIERNGNFFYSSVIKVGKLVSNSFLVYPNPSYNNVVYLNTTIKGLSTVTIFDIMGKQQLQFYANILGVTPLNLGSLSKGNYIIKIENETGSFSNKLVLQ